jgi:hypothetical protein
MLLVLSIILGSLIIIAGIGTLILIQSGNPILFVLATGLLTLFISFLSSLYLRDKPLLARKIQKVCIIIFAIAAINFVSFAIISSAIGGDALNGKVDEGNYFVGAHGYYKEVSYNVFYYSLIHTKSLFITHPLAIFAGWIYFVTSGLGQLLKLLLKAPPQKRRTIIDENKLPTSKH